jgi:hypothetical protein
MLSTKDLKRTETEIIEHATAGRHDAAWAAVQRLLDAQREQEVVAAALVRIVNGRHLPIEKALEVLSQIYDAHPRNEALIASVGMAADCASDIDMLNAAPPTHPLFGNLVGTLSRMAETARGSDAERAILSGLTTAARMMARQHDDIVERSARRLIELEPKVSHHHYNLGLFLKTRGRFREGMLANQTAEALSRERSDACEWNLGICATGAGESTVALQIWKRIGQKIEMGRFDLPDGSYPQCKVRLAERPLAERMAAQDDPGLEETIWIERLSPCHGIIRSVLYQDLGVDYGDVILFDGAPITYHTYDGQKIPVFPHMATLVRSGYRRFDFAATQEHAKQISSITGEFPDDTIVYSHSENYRVLCATCWRDAELEHSHDEIVERHVVTGRIAAPPTLEPRELLHRLDAAVQKREPCRLYVPDLCEAAGLTERAAFERRRFRMIAGANAAQKT